MLISIAVVSVIPGYLIWAFVFAKTTPEQAAQEAQAKLERVGIDASVAAEALWQAYKACRAVGMTNLQTCSQSNGTLIQEIIAPPLAQKGLELQTSYNESCRKQYEVKYCDDLLNRAFHLSQNAK